MIARLKGVSEAREVLHYFAPVGEKDQYVERAFSHIRDSLDATGICARRVGALTDGHWGLP